MGRPATEVAAVRAHTRAQFEALTDRLTHEFGSRLGAGVVLAEVVRAREELLCYGVRAGLVVAVAAQATARLRAAVRSRS